MVFQRRAVRLRSNGTCSDARPWCKLRRSRMAKQPKQDKPNILVIWGDDIGQSNLSCYTHGLMGYQTPNIDRIAKEGMLFTDSYGEQSCTAGRSSFITGQSVLSHRPVEGRHPGRADRHERQDRHDRRRCSRSRATPPASSARTTSATSTTCCRPTTASTSSSATSITSMPRKSRRWTTIPKDPEVPRELRAARRDPLLGDRQGRPDRAAALGQGRQAEDRGHRPAHQEAHGDLRRRVRRRGEGLHQAPGEGRQAVVRVAQHHAHAPVHAHQERRASARRAAGSRPTTTR